MAASRLGILADFLGEAPSQAALRKKHSSVAPRRSEGRHASSDGADSDSERDDAPADDGGFDNTIEYDHVAPFANPKPQRLREFDEPRGFDCHQPHMPVSKLAPKRQLGQRRTSSPSTRGTSGIRSEANFSRGSLSEIDPTRDRQHHISRRSGFSEASLPESVAFSAKQQVARADIAGKGQAKSFLPRPCPGREGVKVVASMGSSVKDLDLMGSTSHRRFGGRA